MFPKFHFTGRTLDGEPVTFELTDIDAIFEDDDVLYITTPANISLPLQLSTIQVHLEMQHDPLPAH